MAYQFFEFEVTQTAIQPFINMPPGQSGTLYFSVETEDIRFRYDGGMPSPSGGHRVYSGQSFSVTKSTEVRNFAMCAVTETAKVTCTVGGQ